MVTEVFYTLRSYFSLFNEPVDEKFISEKVKQVEDLPVSSRQRQPVLLPDDMRFWVSSHLALKDDASSLHQPLSSWFLHEEGSS